MPVSAVWLLTSGPTISPFSPPPSLPPIIGAAVECDAEEYTFDELVSIVRRAYPDDYISSMVQNTNAGFEIFQAAARVGERVSIAIGRRYCCSFVMFAMGGLKATGSVEFFRGSGAAGAITVGAGTVVRTQNNKEFVTTEDAVFSDSFDFGPHTVAIEAAFVGYEWNVPGAVTTAGGELLEGDISRIKKAIFTDGSNPAIDLEMQVRNPAATSGGRDRCLDALGEDLNLPRNLQEGDDAYRLRIQTTPDAVSPNAIRRCINKILNAFGAEVCLREVGTPLFPGFFHDAGSSQDSPQIPANNYAHDTDPTLRVEDRFKLNLSTADFRGFFLVGVPELVDAAYSGLVQDGTSADKFKLKNAHDTVALDAPNAAHDGFTVLNSTIYKSISDSVTAKKAAGVGFTLYIERFGCF